MFMWQYNFKTFPHEFQIICTIMNFRNEVILFLILPLKFRSYNPIRPPNPNWSSLTAKSCILAVLCISISIFISSLESRDQQKCDIDLDLDLLLAFNGNYWFPESPPDLRLTNGETASEGQVEIRISTEEPWGTVCADSKWDYATADVACQHVGYLRADIVFRSQTFGSSEQPILFTGVYTRIHRSNPTLFKWTVLQVGNDCPHEDYAGVACDLRELFRENTNYRQKIILSNSTKIIFFRFISYFWFL